MITFENRNDKGENWEKNQQKREELIDRDTEKANNPHSVYPEKEEQDKTTTFIKQDKPLK